MLSRTQTNTAFGNGAFGSSRPTMTRSSPLRPGAYVPPAQRQGVVINDTNFPALGGAAPAPKKAPVADPARPTLLKVVCDRAIADAAATAAAKDAPQVMDEPPMFLPPVGNFLKRAAERAAREARMRDERELALLCESSSFMRAMLAHRPPTQRYYQEHDFQPTWSDARGDAPEVWESAGSNEDWDDESSGYKSADSDYS